MSITAAAGIELLIQLLNAAGPVSEAIRNAHAAGRTITRNELQDAFDRDDQARTALEAAIAESGTG